TGGRHRATVPEEPADRCSSTETAAPEARTGRTTPRKASTVGGPRTAVVHPARPHGPDRRRETTMALLDERQISEGLAELDGWEWHPDAAEIRRTVAMPDFMSAIGLVQAIAHVAEEAGHHPAIDIRYNRLTFHQTTH